MNLMERAEHLLEHGEMLMSRVSSCYIVTLYQVSGFYAEVWYCQQTPRIHHIDIVKLENVYHLYEGDIDISDIHC